MATLVLGTVGRAVGGRVGGLLGTVAGSFLDRGLLGGKGRREGPRLASLAVQSSAYGEPIPRCYGRTRVAGNLMWSTGIRETLSRSGSKKRGTAATGYSYSSSFAVLISSRPIVELGRIWADGKLLRSSTGAAVVPATIRLYPGTEDQPVDPLIAAAEGIGQAPAYRGRAYVVFEDLPLADFGNRIPNLTFEVIADDGPTLTLDRIAHDVAAVAQVRLATSGSWPRVDGFVASSETARDILARLDDMTGLSVRTEDLGLRLQAGVPRTVAAIDENDLGTTAGEPVARRSDVRAPAATIADAVVVTFSDPARDYQPGQQRATRRTPPLRVDEHSFDATLTASNAKGLATSILRRAHAARTTGIVTLPWRYAGIVPGDLIAVGDDPDSWMVRTATLVGAVVELAVERVAGSLDSASPADSGRVFDPADGPPGDVVLHVLDLPPLPGPLPTGPRLLLAGGSSGRWSRPTVVVSSDGGMSYTAALTLDTPTVMGVAATALPAAGSDRWDRASELVVTLLDTDGWLESRTEAAVLAGANLALVGDEIIQFAEATPLGDGRFRLTTLLRGRRATEAAIDGHAAGERFIVLDADMDAFEAPVEAIGTTLVFKAVRPGEDSIAAAPVGCRLEGRAVRPLEPVFVSADVHDEGIDVAWIRRSRAGFAWIDGIDAPLAEAGEAYRVVVEVGGQHVRVATTAHTSWRYDGGAIAADGIVAGTTITIHVAQLSATAGVGASASVRLTI